MNPGIDAMANGSVETRLGHALILLFEPHAGHERAYNRWYEDDHFYIAGRAAPWAFAGRRWVAPRELQALRLSDDSALKDQGGCYLTLQWVLAGRGGEFQAWTLAMLDRLRREGRGFAERSHVYSTYQDYVGAVYRDPGGPRDIHALDYPYRGVVLEVIEVEPAKPVADLQDWLVSSHIPQKLTGSPAAQCLVFREARADGAMLARAGRGAPDFQERITLLWFLESEPQTCWTNMFGDELESIEASQAGRLVLAAPFIPTLPGTEAYVDQLR